MSKTPVEAILDKVVFFPILRDGMQEIGVYATHQGLLELAGFSFRVYQLNTGERVIDADDVARYFGGTFVPTTPDTVGQ